MEHFFDLPISIAGEEQTLKARLHTFGYSYKFYIIVDGRELVFEKDDEGSYRAIGDNSHGVISNELFEAIILSLKSIVD